MSTIELSPMMVSLYVYISVDRKGHLTRASDDPLAAKIPGRILATDAASEMALTRMRNMVGLHETSCICNRDTATNEGLPLLPTRVLDVGYDSDNPLTYLIVTNRTYAHFISLSHCWGTTVRFTTTNDNVESHVAGIAIQDMPRTFQDAIKVTRRLGIRFLWIDSLCIIQNDDETWQYESAKTAAYYGDAYLTISGDCSSDDTHGVLRKRTTPRAAEYKGHGHQVTLCHEGQARSFEYHAQGRTCRLYLMLDNSDRHFLDNPDPVGTEALQCRAWTLQERYLSKRILHFGTDQNYIEQTGCYDGIWFENGQYTYRSCFWDYLCQPRMDLSFQGWYAMIEQYTRRQLTYKTDTLPALSGLAQLVQALVKGEYCAGLWKADLSRGLLWKRNTGGKSNQMEKYIAPSWSWAGQQGPVSFLLNDLSNKIDPDSCQNGHDHDADDTDKTLIMNVVYQSQLFRSDPFGRLKSASLILSAPIFSICGIETRDEPYKQLEILFEIGQEVHSSTAYLDNPKDGGRIGQDASFAVMFIAYTQGPSFRSKDITFKTSFGLILEKSISNNSVYQRVGSFKGRVQIEAYSKFYEQVILM